MATKEELFAALTAAAKDGWTAERTTTGITLRKLAERPTPEWVRPEWWPQPTYESGLWLTVSLVRGKTIITAREWRRPWVSPSDRSLSRKAAIEFLAREPE